MNIKAAQTIEKYGMLHGANMVIVGLSGGADSMALFHFLYENKARYGIEVAAAHINHGLRGAAADADEGAVRALCEKTGTQLFVKHAKMLERPRPQGQGTEEWGRAQRYAFFEELAQAHTALVATAHTLPDNAETLLFNLARGTGLNGLSGIAPKRGVFIRPLIETTRGEVEEYCAQNNLAFVTDETNFEDNYTRNRIRHHIVPAMQEINPAFLSGVNALTQEMVQVHGYMVRAAQQLLQSAQVPCAQMFSVHGQNAYSCEVLLAADAVLLNQALYLLLQPTGALSRRAVELCAACLEKGGCVQVSAKYIFTVKNGVCALENAVDIKPPQEDNAKYEIPLAAGVYELFGGHVLTLEQLPYEKFVNNCENGKNSLKNALDYDIIKDTSFIRTRAQGDTFRPQGRGLTKSVKKYMSELKIPLNTRGTLPLIACGAKVQYIAGVGAAEDAMPTAQTKTVLYITHTVRACGG